MDKIKGEFFCIRCGEAFNDGFKYKMTPSRYNGKGTIVFYLCKDCATEFGLWLNGGDSRF